ILESSPETVNLVLFGGNVGSSPSILTINDVPPTGTTATPTPTATTPAPTAVGNTYFFGAPNYSVTEGSAATITINRSGDLSIPGAITFSTGGGSAKAGTAGDYVSVVQSFNFAAGQTSVQVPVQALTDPLTENTETVGLFLSGGSLASPSVGVLSIIDTTPVPPISFFYGSSPDPIIDGGTGVVMINRTGGNTSVSVSVDYFILPPGPGEPINTQQYTITNPGGGNISGGTLSFNPGVTSVSLTIQNTSGPLTGDVTFGFGPGANVGNPGFATITLI
ncbi:MULTISPECIES: Calx-beta domain-containing protein, partial [unclassified Microcoleus]|uniref:Calx-beta domain-containing protein n=1 Tax=unclassified Microcoleus TaxID=2642155 RepID=UPI002FD4DC4E